MLWLRTWLCVHLMLRLRLHESPLVEPGVRALLLS
jgi:hypothetical protein